MNPFIIWTMQRTGGTNFASHLIKLSKLPATEHEPLNIGRAYGGIASAWKAERDKGKLNLGIDKFLAQGFAFKHCVEMVEPDINSCLAESTPRHGYSHIVLYRNNAADRLISLHFAQETGLWGKKKVSEAITKNGDNFRKNINVNKIDADLLIEHEDICINYTLDTIREIRSSGSNVNFISFEDLYNSHQDHTTAKLTRLMTNLGFSKPEYIRDAVKNLATSEGQGSKFLYKDIPGQSDLEKKLQGFSGLRERVLLEFPDMEI